MKTMQTKLTLIIVLGILLATFISGALSMASFISVEQERSADILEKESELYASYLDELFSDTEGCVNILSAYCMDNCPEVSELLKQQGEEYLTECKELATNLVANNDAVCAVYFRLNPEITNSTAGFFLSKSPEDDNMVEYPSTDIALYSPDDTEHVGWYYVPIEAGKAVWMDEYFNLNNGILMISYVMPLYLEDGTILGVVGIDLNMEDVYQRITQMQLYEDGFAALMSGTGEIRNAAKNINITEDDKKKVLASEEDATLTYIDKQREMTLVVKKVQNGDYLLLAIANDDLYERENKVVLTIILVTVLVSALVILLLTGLLARMVNKFKRDNMTGAENRTSYMDEITEMDNAIRLKRKIAFTVIVFDLNGLKKTNDELGHACGDKLIVDASKLICKYFPKMPLYRIGGDEFVICAKHSLIGAMSYRFEEFRKEMERRIQDYDFSKGTVVISSGISTYDENTDHCYEDVFRRADEDMYSNKQKFYQTNPILDRRKRD